ncbi:DUF3545 family protein [Glaciecola petra]|uniref:DUF3545 family protein n=1 Tax=Glaciecola petra TaxID=3075602 RepID=A0ABU2ZPD3_9ALTE|nr:DUF3545 family protein [Aestuariibacter sp. P117]MDT0593449.1 DUF3545 family protein [Aestuariibacter sp. P117]
MESVDFLKTIDRETRGAKTNSKKRKWREIEAIQENYRLKKELCDMDMEFAQELERAR